MTCVHHWILGDGIEEVPGECKHCGAVRMFDGRVFQGDPFSLQPKSAREVKSQRLRAGKAGGAATRAKFAKEVA